MLPEMPIPEPDFRKLDAYLLNQFESIELKVHDLIDNGYAVSLLPFRGSNDLKLDHVDLRSLPAIDLKVAGIETDRRPQTIYAEIEKLLAGRRFTIHPDFNPTVVCCLLPSIVQMFGIMQIKWEMQCIGPFGSMPEPEKDIDRVMKNLPMLEFLVMLEGEPILGLDLSKPVKGAFPPIANFACPVNTLKEGSELDALRAAVNFQEWKDALSNNLRDGQSYLDTSEQKWWFPLWNKKKKIERKLKRIYDGLLAANQALELKLAALP